MMKVVRIIPLVLVGLLTGCAGSQEPSHHATVSTAHHPSDSRVIGQEQSEMHAFVASMERRALFTSYGRPNGALYFIQSSAANPFWDPNGSVDDLVSNSSPPELIAHQWAKVYAKYHPGVTAEVRVIFEDSSMRVDFDNTGCSGPGRGCLLIVSSHIKRGVPQGD